MISVFLSNGDLGREGFRGSEAQYRAIQALRLAPSSLFRGQLRYSFPSGLVD